MPTDFSALASDADGFPELFQRIPDTSVTQFFTGLYILDFDKRREASQTAIAYGEAYLKSLIDPAIPRPQIPELMREMKSLGASHSNGMPLKLLKQWTGAMKSDKPGARRMSGPAKPALIAYADKFEIMPAAEMRKLLKGDLAERFGLKAEKWGGAWRYLNPERRVGLEIDFSGSYGQQLRYRILHPHAGVGISLEAMWGIGIGDWDFIHRGNWELTMELLGEIYGFFDGVLPMPARLGD